MSLCRLTPYVLYWLYLPVTVGQRDPRLHARHALGGILSTYIYRSVRLEVRSSPAVVSNPVWAPPAKTN